MTKIAVLLTIKPQGHTIELIENWLNPPKSQAIFGALDDAKGLRIDGTAEWIFSDLNFAAWNLNNHETVAANGPYENMLWIRGRFCIDIPHLTC